MEVKKGAYIITCSGRKVYPLDADPNEICIEDIAHSLSQQCRFTGHTRLFYSTAEHCVHVSRLCDPADALHGLLHDGGEAFMSDLARPIKHHSQMVAYRDAEHKLTEVVFKAFGLGAKEPESVKNADRLCGLIEARDLMPGPWSEWESWGPLPTNPLDLRNPWDSRKAELEFLVRYYQLTYNNLARGAKGGATK